MDTSILPAISLYAPDFIGFLLPPVIEIMNKDKTNEKQKFIISMAVCLVAAFFTKYNSLTGGDYNSVLTSFGIIFVESQVIFKLYFKNSFFRSVMVERLTKTEDKTEDPVG